MAARKLNNSKGMSKRELDAKKFVAQWAKNADVQDWFVELRSGFKNAIANELGIKKSSVTEKQLYQCVHALMRSGTLDIALRDMGLVPKPSIGSAILGWHDFEHLRSRGLANKVAGGTAITAKLGLLIIGALKGAEYLTR